MYKLEPNDIQAMIAEAAKVLTQPDDREIMRRLVANAHATPESEWDKRLMATMLAKAGKMHEAELVANDIDVLWQKAEALWSMGKVLLESGDRNQALGLLHQSALAAAKGQESGTPDERMDAAGVIEDIAKSLDAAGEKAQAEEVRSMMSLKR